MNARTNHARLRERYEAWVREHHVAVWRAARRLLRDDEAASDVAQRVYLHAVERHYDVPEGQHAAHFLCWLACKEALSELRARKRRARHDQEAAMRTESDTRPDPAVAAGAAEARAWLARELDALADELRRVLVLRYQQGLSLREIGALLELTESSVHERVERGLGRLRKRAEQAGLAGVLADVHAELALSELLAAPPSTLLAALEAAAPAAPMVSAFGSWLVAALACCVAGSGALLWRGCDGSVREPAHASVAGVEFATISAPSTTDDLEPVAELAAVQRAPVEAQSPEAPALAAAAPSRPIAADAALALRGRLIDVDGAPLSGFRVRCFEACKTEADAQVVRTDADGAFEFTFARAARFPYHVEVEAVAYTRGAYGVFAESTASTPLVLQSSQRASQLVGDWELEFRALDWNGAAVHGLVITLTQEGWFGTGRPGYSQPAWPLAVSDRTNAAGVARFADHGFGRYSYEVRDPLERHRPMGGVLELRTSQLTEPLHIAPSVPVRGRLVTPDGGPLDDRPVALDQGVGSRQTLVVDAATGAFSTLAWPGRAFVLERSGGRYAGIRARFEPPFREPIELALKRADDTSDAALHAGELHGRLFDVDGPPLALHTGAVTAVLMDAQWAGIDTEWRGEFWSGAAGWLQRSYGRGEGLDDTPSSEFHLTGLAPGRYAVVASEARRPLGIAGPFDIDADARGQGSIITGIDVRFERGWSIDVAIPDVPAEAVQHAWVHLVGGAAFELPGSEKRPLAREVKFGALHPRATYRVVLADPRGQLASSPPLCAPGDSDVVSVTLAWPR